MRAFDLLAVGVVGCAVVAAVVVSASRTLHTEPAAPFTMPRNVDPHGAMSAGVALREGIDPLRPPGLPDGVSIDKDTGLLLGMELAPADGQVAVPWSTLKSADGVKAADALPTDLRALAGRTVVLAGFVMPLYEIADIREFLLVGSHYACCFGTPPGLGGMTMVKLAPSSAPIQPTLAPLRIVGRFAIRERRQGPGPDEPLLLLFEIEDAEAGPLG